MCTKMLADCCWIVGDSAKDAVGVCANEMEDPQLALFLCRLLEGGEGPLQRYVLQSELIPGKQASNPSSSTAK